MTHPEYVRDAVYAAAKFPLLDYTPETAVSHNRKALIEAIKYLRQQGIYILDKPIVRLQ